jgi:predicted transport protein
MISNLQQKTGKSLAEWIEIINQQPFTKTSDKVKYLKSTFGLGHGYAGLIIYHAKVEAAGKSDNPEELLEKQYQGKEQLKPIYDKLLSEVIKFGADVEIAPKNSYVSLRRNVQFAMLTPATKVRFEVALKLKNQEPNGILEALPKNGMCTHRIKLSSVEDISNEVIGWLKAAYDKAD